MSAPGAPAWATRATGFGVRHLSSDAGFDARALVLPGLRRNPKRAHLLVSTVLGKHIPADPAAVIGSGARLAELVGRELARGQDGAPAVPEDCVVLGFAETATGLGHCVAEAMRAACYLHSTRRNAPGMRVFGEFEEGHSHATRHLLAPTSPQLFAKSSPLVLVDDEISTGATAIDAIRALHAMAPRSRYIVASLVDMRRESHRDECAKAAAELGVRIDFTALAAGRAVLPDDLVARVAALPEPQLNPVARVEGTLARVDLPWPAGVADGGRHGFTPADRAGFSAAIAAAAEALAARLDPARPVIVIGHEELMYLPLRLAYALTADFAVRFQTTTRSPAYVVDEPGYPLRRGFCFTAPEPGEEDAPRYLYNAQWPGDDRAQLVVVLDTPADTELLTAPGGLADVLVSAGEDATLAVVPASDQQILAEFRAVKGQS